MDFVQANSVIEIISLDHDLGDNDHGTGFDVVLWADGLTKKACWVRLLYGCSLGLMAPMRLTGP